MLRNTTIQLQQHQVSSGFISNIYFFRNTGLFIQGNTHLFKNKLLVSAGARVDANNYSTSMSNPLDQLSPSTSALSLAITDKFFLNANVGRYFELPPYTSMGFKNQAGVLVNKQNGITYIQSDHLVGRY